MTIASQTSRIAYTGDGATTGFPVPFYFAANADLVVYLQDTLGNQTPQILGTNYNLTGATVSSGGACTFVTAPTTGYLISIYRDPPATQTTSYNNNDPFPAKSHENALDKLTTLAQRTKDIALRSIRQTEGEASMITTLAPVATRKNKLFGFGTNGELTYPLGPTFVAGTAVGVATFDSRATAQVTTIPVSSNIVITGGYAAAGDMGGATYKKVASQPSHSGKFQSADGAWWEVIGPIYNWRAFGAVGDGVANDYAAIQGTIDAAVLIGGESYGPPGTYKILTGLSITGRMRFYGAGADDIFSSGSGPKSTNIIPSTGGINGIFVNTSHPVILEKFRLTWGVTPGAGVGIILDAPGGGTIANSDSIIRDVTVLGADVGIKTVNAQVFCIDHVGIWNCISHGAYLQWVNQPGSGDSNFTNSTFSGAPTIAQVTVKSGGGLRFINNKTNQNSTGISVLISPDQITSQGISPLLIANNSMEGANIGILFQRLAGVTEVVGNVVITGNELGGPGGGIVMQALVTNPTVPWILTGVICGNIIYGGVQVAGASGFLIASNQFFITGTFGIDPASTSTISTHSNSFGAGTTSPAASTPAVVSGTNIINSNPFSVMVCVTGGTGTQIQYNAGPLFAFASGAFNQTVILYPRDTIQLVYTVAPTWTWRPVDP